MDDCVTSSDSSDLDGSDSIDFSEPEMVDLQSEISTTDSIDEEDASFNKPDLSESNTKENDWVGENDDGARIVNSIESMSEEVLPEMDTSAYSSTEVQQEENDLRANQFGSDSPFLDHISSNEANIPDDVSQPLPDSDEGNAAFDGNQATANEEYTTQTVAEQSTDNDDFITDIDGEQPFKDTENMPETDVQQGLEIVETDQVVNAEQEPEREENTPSHNESTREINAEQETESKDTDQEINTENELNDHETISAIDVEQQSKGEKELPADVASQAQKEESIQSRLHPEILHPEEEVKLEDLKPNSVYERNGYEYKTDELGRTREVSGNLVLLPGERSALQTKIGKMGFKTDEGGHIIARRFNGPTDAFNIRPEDVNFNRGEWKTLENSWGKAMDEGKEVKVMVEPVYADDSIRPVSLEVVSQIDGEITYTEFMNQASEKNK